MKLTNKIIRFTIGKANYFISGSKGEQIELNLDYANNTYSVKIETGEISEDFRNQIRVLAEHLLGEKAQKNLVNKLQKKKVIP